MPILVPNPTRNPLTMYPNGLTIAILGSTPNLWSIIASPSTYATYARTVSKNAAMNDSFHCWEDSVNVLRGVRMKEEAMPEAPRMSPEKRRRVAAERPMRDPPNRPETGEKALILVG